MRTLGAITPKWLTLRLRELEEAGIVERDEERGRREVRYRLTERGRALAPVIGDLAVWGIDHALRPPLPGESIHPAQATTPFVAYLNRKRMRLPEPVTWSVRVGAGDPHLIRYNGERWSLDPGEAPADVVIETTPEVWTSFLAGSLEERRRWLDRMQVQGSPEHVEDFVTTMGKQETNAERGTRNAEQGTAAFTERE